MRWSQYLDADHFLVLYFPLVTSLLLAIFRQRSMRHNVLTISAVAAVAVVLVTARLWSADLSAAARALAALLVAAQFGALLFVSRAHVFDRHPFAFVAAGPLVFWVTGLAIVGIWFALGLRL